MSEKTKSEVISRRSVLSLLGLAPLSVAMPSALLNVSDAEAQQAAPTQPLVSPPPFGQPAAPQTGTESRQERRKHRRERRHERRAHRRERREERRKHRKERRKGTEEKK